MTASRFVRWWSDPKNQAKVDQIKAYRSTPEYKERERQRKKLAQQRKKGLAKLPKPRVYHFKDQDYIIWSVGRVAHCLGVHKRTISNLERKSTIPTNRITDSNNRRWWPASYIRWLKPYFDLKNSGDISSKEFSRRVWKDWRQAVAAGVFPVLAEVKHDEGPQKAPDGRGHCSLTDIFDNPRGPDHREGQSDN